MICPNCSISMVLQNRVKTYKDNKILYECYICYDCGFSASTIDQMADLQDKMLKIIGA